jgi:sugar phosphate isomerase/epimerase
MNIKYLCTYWGCEHLSAKSFLDLVIKNGYDGVEINFPDDTSFIEEFLSELQSIRKSTHPKFIFVAQQVLPSSIETYESFVQRVLDRLQFLVSLGPDAINSHTGKDFYDFGENSKILELINQISKTSTIPILHETHRGRFSFHAKTLLNYLDLFPHLKLVGDLSHFGVVSESNLEDQEAILTKIFPKINHIHARIGFEQSPQVNDPFAPEWNGYLERYLLWWNQIISIQEKRGLTEIMITPECGPYPYMPEKPFSKEPLSNQWDNNIRMMHYLKQNLK